MRLHSPRELGLLIRQRRRAQKLGQAELARRVGVSRFWVIEAEKGNPGAELGLILRTLRALGLIVEVRPEDEPGPSAKERKAPGPGAKGRKTPPAVPAVNIDAIIEAARRRID